MKKNRSKEKDRQDKKGDTDGFQKSTVRGLQNPAKVNPASTVGIDPIASNPGGVSKLPEEKEKSKERKQYSEGDGGPLGLLTQK